jgi:hypothetical protein
MERKGGGALGGGERTEPAFTGSENARRPHIIGKPASTGEYRISQRTKIDPGRLDLPGLYDYQYTKIITAGRYFVCCDDGIFAFSVFSQENDATLFPMA